MSSKADMIAIGDIHGCNNTCKSLLHQLDEEYHTKPTYVFLGDYTDRGPDSKDVVDQLLAFEEDHDCVFIRGNHDQMLLDAYENGHWELWMANGGSTTLRNYDSSPGQFDLPESHYRFFSETKWYWETEHFFFVHAGLNPNKTIRENLEDENDREELIWQRSHLHAQTTKWEKTVVFGHTPVLEPLVRDAMIGIDTGCVYNRDGLGKLTAVVLPEQKFIQQQSLDA
ncbi:metallophosphoesterase family protein [Gracilimonas tropica]|uniref:metallophosphoesterase family protein n=1 Tax=Gracilimonas tropica TaxID=454600 RepID=UPI00035F4CE3|nr:metallophosphoesterase family protein [Gracilimonas tropica]